MDKILLIVDPQVDFISGSLAVEGAKEKMDALTNDTGFKPANIVMKLISCQMNVNQPVYGCVKLSDDAGKHTGEMREVKSCLSELGLWAN